MKKPWLIPTRLAALLLALLMLLSTPAMAAGVGMFGVEHPAIFTILALGAPKDMTVTIHIHKKGEIIPVTLDAQRKLWEGQYRLYREAAWRIGSWYGNPYDLKDAELVFESGGVQRSLVIPDEMLSGNGRNAQDYATYYWRSGTLVKGIPWWRSPLLYALWLAVGLLVEGVIFALYGFRRRKSWLWFFLINLVSVCGHHAFVAGFFLTVNRIRLYLFLIPIFYLAELVAFVLLVDERGRDKSIGFAALANLVSQMVLGLLIGTLPS